MCKQKTAETNYVITKEDYDNIRLR